VNRRHHQLVADSASGGTVVVWAESACYSVALRGAVCRVGARFSVMVQIDPTIAAAIAAIG
jgi:hypothetical protein